jgi:single-stranded DNA-binding protein
MTIQAVMRGRIVEGPYAAETDTEEFVATFTLGDRQTGMYRSRKYDIEDLETCEVICRGTWAMNVASDLHEGDRVVVLGQIRVAASLGQLDESQLVLLTVEADTVAMDLGAIDN